MTMRFPKAEYITAEGDSPYDDYNRAIAEGGTITAVRVQYKCPSCDQENTFIHSPPIPKGTSHWCDDCGRKNSIDDKTSVHPYLEHDAHEIERTVERIEKQRQVRKFAERNPKTAKRFTAGRSKATFSGIALSAVAILAAYLTVTSIEFVGVFGYVFNSVSSLFPAFPIPGAIPMFTADPFGITLLFGTLLVGYGIHRYYCTLRERLQQSLPTHLSVKDVTRNTELIKAGYRNPEKEKQRNKNKEPEKEILTEKE